MEGIPEIAASVACGETERPSGELSVFDRTLARWLLIFGQVYHRDLDELAIAAYREALSGLSPRLLDAACRYLVRRSKFLPNPAEILEAAELVAERLPKLPAPECALCGGTGWKVIERDGARFAVRCAHGGEAPPAAPAHDPISRGAQASR
jgi:hypothetical protein